jgi:hypothetical protein
VNSPQGPSGRTDSAIRAPPSPASGAAPLRNLLEQNKKVNLSRNCSAWARRKGFDSRQGKGICLYYEVHGFDTCAVHCTLDITEAITHTSSTDIHNVVVLCSNNAKWSKLLQIFINYSSHTINRKCNSVQEYDRRYFFQEL